MPSKNDIVLSLSDLLMFRDRLQISLLILSEFEQINKLLFPLKSSENHSFSDDLKGNRS